MDRRRFALDEDFPDTILEALKLGVREADLVPIRKIDERLRQMDDWKLLLSLAHHPESWDGLISADSNMLKLPREISVLHQTRLTLVVVDRAGHDPIRAAGLILVHLPGICAKTVKTKGQIWRLSASAKNHEDPWEELKKIAQHQNTSVKNLFEANRLKKRDLERNPLDELPFD